MKNKIMNFVKQNGFLLFLFICVCAVAAGTIYVSTGDLREAKETKEDELVILEEVSSIDETTNEEEALENGGIEKEEETVKNEEVSEESLEEEFVEEVMKEDELSEDVAQQAGSESIEFVDDNEEDDDTDLVIEQQTASFLPVEGEIITEFTGDKLTYSSTLDEWRYHGGIDIKAPIGTDVIVPLDGTVKEVLEDDLWGITIIIDHGNGLESKYSNLGTKEMVKPGVSVNAGDCISVVGQTAKIEMKMEPHLHYEISKDGKNIDPRSITN